MKRPIPVLVALLLLAPLLGGCHKVRARVELKKGNEMYLNESYKAALIQYQKGLELDPSATFAWRSVGLSALALYRPGDTSKANKDLGNLAIQGFENYLKDYPDDEKIRDYLMATYVNSKQFQKALDYLAQQAQEHPENENIQAQRVRLLIEADRLPEAMQITSQLPSGQAKAEALYTIGVTIWDESYHRGDMMPPAERGKLVDQALAGMDEALRIKPDYFEAMVYTNLLLIEKGKMEVDEARKQEYMAQASQWREKAKALRKKQQEEEKKKQAEAAKTTES